MYFLCCVCSCRGKYCYFHFTDVNLRLRSQRLSEGRIVTQDLTLEDTEHNLFLWQLCWRLNNKKMTVLGLEGLNVEYICNQRVCVQAVIHTDPLERERGTIIIMPVQPVQNGCLLSPSLSVCPKGKTVHLWTHSCLCRSFE